MSVPSSSNILYTKFPTKDLKYVQLSPIVLNSNDYFPFQVDLSLPIGVFLDVTIPLQVLSIAVRETARYLTTLNYVYLYTNGKNKQCIAKMFITQKVCGAWAWKFMNIFSLIQTYNYKTFTRFHVCFVRHLYFLWKLLFMSSASEKQHAIKLIDAKCKFMQLMMRKPLFFS